MILNATDIEFVKKNYILVRAQLETHSDDFYAILFRTAPELQSMFRDDLEGQGMKFMSTLGIIVRHLGDPDAMDEKLSQLGHAHASLGVSRRQFDPMETALIETLRLASGEDFTPRLEAAWRAAFAEIRDAMVRLGDIPDA